MALDMRCIECNKPMNIFGGLCLTCWGKTPEGLKQWIEFLDNIKKA